jgi:hypothetical protein
VIIVKLIWLLFGQIIALDLESINFLQPTCYMTHHQYTSNNCMLCPHCIYVFCIYLRTNSGLRHLQQKLIGFYNRDEKCLQRGTDWVFK